MGKLTGHVTPPPTLDIRITHKGVTFSMPLLVPDLDKMSDEVKEALRARLEAGIDEKQKEDLWLQYQRQQERMSIGVDKATGPDRTVVYRSGRGLAADLIIGDDTQHLPKVPQSTEKSTVPVGYRNPWTVDGKLCLTTTAHVQALLARRTAVRTDGGGLLGG